MLFIDEGISIQVCWDSSNIQDSNTELIKGAYCTLLDVPHVSKIPKSGNFNIIYVKEKKTSK